jgi:hypothetical protein
MDLRNLVNAILDGDLLSARQWVADAQHEKVSWEYLECPHDFDGQKLVVAAALAELLAGRAGQNAPTWTHKVGAERELLVLDPGLEQMPRSFARAKAFGPEPLRKRNLLALPDFLDVA